MKRFIFLDIDGVLNSYNLAEREYVPGTKIIGVEDRLLRNLKMICEAFPDIEIILISTWKLHWSVDKLLEHDHQGDYLDRRFAEYGMCISDKSKGVASWNRGEGIKIYLSSQNIEGCRWVVIDDCVFEDYDKEIKKHLVQTDNKTGLSSLNVSQAIEILK